MREIGLFLLLMLLWTAAQVLLKSGMNELSGRKVDLRFFTQALSSWPVVTGLFLSVVAAFLWLVVLSRFELSYSYLMAGLTFVFVVIASAVFLEENISLVRWLGALLIALGVYFVSRTR